MPRTLTTSAHQQILSSDRTTNLLLSVGDTVQSVSYCQYFEFAFSGTTQLNLDVNGRIVSYFHECPEPADYSLVDVEGNDIYRAFYSKVSLELLAPTEVYGIGVNINAASGTSTGIFRAVVCYE